MADANTGTQSLETTLKADLEALKQKAIAEVTKLAAEAKAEIKKIEAKATPELKKIEGDIVKAEKWFLDEILERFQKKPVANTVANTVAVANTAAANSGVI